MAVVFIAGPLSGLIFQPFVGVAGGSFLRSPSYSCSAMQERSLTAKSQDSKGAGRSCIMISSAIVTAAATVLLEFTRPVAGMSSEEGSKLVRASVLYGVVDGALVAHRYSTLAIWLAILAISITGFSINAATCGMDSQYT